jgi:hypothetical protein
VVMAQENKNHHHLELYNKNLHIMAWNCKNKVNFRSHSENESTKKQNLTHFELSQSMQNSTKFFKGNIAVNNQEIHI